MSKNITTEKAKKILSAPISHGRDYLKSYSFVIQKWVIFVMVAVFTYLTLDDIDIFKHLSTQEFIRKWPNMAYDGFVVWLIIFTAKPMTKFVSSSLIKQWVAWVIIALFLTYLFCLYFLGTQINVLDYKEVVGKGIWWTIPALSLPVVSCVWAAIINRNVSPVLSKFFWFSFVTNAAFSVITACSGTILYKKFVKKDPLNIADLDIAYSILISVIILAGLVWITSMIITFKRFHGIKTAVRTVSVPYFVYIPIYVGFTVWLGSGWLEQVHWGTGDTVFVVISFVIALAMVAYLQFSRGKLRSSKIAVSILALGILAIWAVVFIYVHQFSFTDTTYTSICLASIFTAGILVVISIMNPKMHIIETLALIGLLLLSAVATTGFYLINKTGMLNASTASIADKILDLETMIMALFLIAPSIFFSVVVFKIIIAPLQINHSVGKEGKIIKKKSYLSKKDKRALMLLEKNQNSVDNEPPNESDENDVVEELTPQAVVEGGSNA